MTQDTNNPFVLPGFGQTGESGNNPLFAGLEMMHQAWRNVASGNQIGATPAMSIEDLDKRIRELQTVQNWLQLNSTMLANTIQGLEIQRSTLAMMQSFAPNIKPDQKETETTESATASQDHVQSANEWWQLIQQQFDQLSKAATANLQSMVDKPAEKPVKSPKKPAAKKTAGNKATTSTKTTKKTTGKK